MTDECGEAKECNNLKYQHYLTLRTPTSDILILLPIELVTIEQNEWQREKSLFR